MRIKILSSNVDDLHAGRLFYEQLADGVGAYFFDSPFSDIGSLALYAGSSFYFSIRAVFCRACRRQSRGRRRAPARAVIPAIHENRMMAAIWFMYRRLQEMVTALKA